MIIGLFVYRYRLQFLLNRNTMLLLDCPAHNLPYSKLCANQQCCDLLCDLCLAGHTERTAHTTAIFLNTHSLNFFQVFTQKIHAVMMHWAQTVRREGIGAIFVLRREDGAEDIWPNVANQKSEIAAKVLEEHGRLMASNCSFATSNCNSPLLYHPQFLKDLFNLIVHPWKANARLMLNKLTQSVNQIHGTIDKQMVHFELRQDASVQIQTFRRELLSQKQNRLLWHLSQQKTNKSLESNTNDRSGSSGGDFSCEGREVSQFHLPASSPSIKTIENCQQIEQLAHPPTDSPSAAPQIAAENAYNISIKQSSENESLLADSMPKLLEQNRQLIKQNSLLKNENLVLREEIQIQKQKCLKMRSERGQSASSSKKYRDADLNGELVRELVQLQAELSDNRHDLQILAEYLNCLSKQRIIDRNEFNCKMQSLRTLAMH